MTEDWVPVKDVMKYQDDIRKLARELDVAVNGEEGAAPAPAMVDVVAQLIGMFAGRVNVMHYSRSIFDVQIACGSEEALRFSGNVQEVQCIPCLRALAQSSFITSGSQWEPGRWWRVLDGNGKLWCESSGEEENRRAVITAPGPVENVKLQRMWVYQKTEWRDMEITL